MGRRKIEIKAIKDDRNRSVTFLKRKGGLFKKAHELSVLCSVDVAVIIFGHNKKLYEYSSGDINDTIGRFQYYGGAHERKGPADFDGGAMDDDDEEDMGSPPIDNALPREPNLHPHLQNQSYMRTAASASPPMPNGMPNGMSNGVPMYPRQGTPSGQMGSRPGSRNAMRRSSSNLGPSHLQQVTQAPQNANGFAYMRNTPAIYTPPSGQGMPGAHPRQQSSGQVQYYNQLQQVANSQVQQSYLQEQRRQSMSTSFSQSEQQQQQHHPAHIPSPPQTDSEQRQDEQRLTKPIPTAKSRSIFTPVDDSRSLLAAHWGGSKTVAKENIKQDKDSRPTEKPGSPRLARTNGSTSPPPSAPRDAPPIIRRSDSSEFITPSRTDTQLGAKRPRLKVQIPEEQSEAGSPTSENSKAAQGETPPKGSGDAGHTSGTGVVLPPPSPSASALLSAGAQGPPNPFARPAPPPMGGQSRDNMETPISALPSRFVADGLLPSPSSFYPEWSYGRSGGESATILPSPLNFQMPMPNRDEEGDKKRKSPEAETPQIETAKRIKA